jgi:hypothetical protein
LPTAKLALFFANAYIGDVGFLTRRNFTLTAIAALFVPRRWAWAAPAASPVMEWDDVCVDHALATMEARKARRATEMAAGALKRAGDVAHR